MRVFVVVCALLAACGSSKPSTPPPPPPSGLTAVGGAGTISLSWTGSAGATSYNVLRGDAPRAEANPVASAVTTFQDIGLSAGKTYYYVVQAVGAGGTSGNSNEASAVTAPDVPTGVKVVTTDVSATVSWDAMPGATSYDVQRAAGGASFSPVGTVSSNSLSDGGLTPNTNYVYEIRASNSSGQSGYATVNATTAPGAPTGVTVSGVANHHVSLSWTAPANAGTGGYRVLHSTSSSGPFTPAGTSTSTSFTDTMLTNNTNWYFVVHTMGGSGESRDSNLVSATPFIEICAVDAASYAVSVFDGTAIGNAAPKRSFGWKTGIAEGTGIGTDGTNIFIASKYTQTVNVYPRATVTGDQAPSRTISLPGQPTALTVDGANSEVYVGIGNKIYVYASSASGTATEKRSLTMPAGMGTISGITGIQVFSGLTGATSVNQTFVLADNKILVYANGASGTTAPVVTFTPAGTTQFTRLSGPAYDNSTDDAIFVGWHDATARHTFVASFSRTTGAAVRTIQDGGDPAFSANSIVGGIVLDGTNVWFTLGGTGVNDTSLLRYPHTGTPNAPTAGFVGVNTRLYKPGPLVLDGSGELWFVNGKNGAAAYAKTSTSVNSAPLHSLTGEATGLYDPADMGVDRVNGEIVVMNRSFWNPAAASWGTGHAINVYPLAPVAPVTPARTIVGPTVNLDRASDPPNLAVDEANGEYWIAWVNLSGQLVFEALPRAPGGDETPARAIGGPTSTNDLTFGSMFYDAKGGAIVAIFPGPGTNNNTLRSWPRTASGDVAPSVSATLATPVAFTPAIDFAHDLLFLMTDSSVMSVLPRAFPGGTLAAGGTVDTSAVPATLSAVDGEGDELYFRIQNEIIVTPRSTSGALSPVRTITGSATQLFNTARLVICN